MACVERGGGGGLVVCLMTMDVLKVCIHNIIGLAMNAEGRKALFA